MREYVAVTPSKSGWGGYWGSGTSIEEAKASLKKQGGNLNRVVVFELPEGAVGGCMNDFGSPAWFWDEDFTGERTYETTVVYKRGVKLTQND